MVQENQNQSVEKKSVIIIDDDEDTPQLFADLLEEYGIKVLAQGCDGKSAITLYQKYFPDVTLVDMMMSNGDGIFAIDGIRKINPDAKIIMMTGHLTPLISEKLQKLGISVIYKPCKMELVVSHISNS